VTAFSHNARSLDLISSGKRIISQQRSPTARRCAVNRASPRLLPALPGNSRLHTSVTDGSPFTTQHLLRRL
jgi:hypothetical protein